MTGGKAPPSELLEETIDALRETADLIDVAGDEMMEGMARGFWTASEVLNDFRAAPGHDLFQTSGILGDVGADLQTMSGEPAWAGWAL